MNHRPADNPSGYTGSKVLRRVCVLLPCAPGLTLLLAGTAVLWTDRGDGWRAEPLLVAGGAVLLAGMVIGALVSWRLDHPRPEEEDEGPPSSQ